MLVYMVHNKVNGKLYVGKTTKDVKRRWAEHLSSAKGGSKYYFHAAIRKYGADAFVVTPISGWASSEEDLAEQERYFIKKYRTNNPKIGYNLTEGGEGTLGHTLYLEAREKIRQSRLGRSSWNSGISPSNVTRALIGAAHKGNKYCLGRKLSEATKQKIAMKATGRLASDELCRVRSQNAQGVNNPMYGRNQKSPPAVLFVRNDWKEKRQTTLPLVMLQRVTMFDGMLTGVL